MKLLLLILMSLFATCSEQGDKQAVVQAGTMQAKADTPTHANATNDTLGPFTGNSINTGNTTPVELVEFAKTLIGTPYRYGSADISRGFDCSGFITYVFNHFNIAVPRSSVGFTNVGNQISLTEARQGDLILFTGTNSAIRTVGHMGIVTGTSEGLVRFIHSTSGKQYSVTITPLEKHYTGRFIKVIRVF